MDHTDSGFDASKTGSSIAFSGFASSSTCFPNMLLSHSLVAGDSGAPPSPASLRSF